MSALTMKRQIRKVINGYFAAEKGALYEWNLWKKGLKTKNLDLENLCTSGYKFLRAEKGIFSFDINLLNVTCSNTTINFKFSFKIFKAKKKAKKFQKKDYSIWSSFE